VQGKPHAPFDVAGAGNVARSKCWDTRNRKGEPTGNPNLDLHRARQSSTLLSNKKADVGERPELGGSKRCPELATEGDHPRPGAAVQDVCANDCSSPLAASRELIERAAMEKLPAVEHESKPAAAFSNRDWLDDQARHIGGVKFAWQCFGARTARRRDDVPNRRAVRFRWR